MNKYYTTSDIGKLAGITRKTVGSYIKKQGIEPVTKQGNIPKYDDKVKDKIVNHYIGADKSKKVKEEDNDEVKRLKDKIVKLEQENERLHSKVEDFTDKFYKLANQAQQLDYAKLETEKHEVKKIVEPVKTEKTKPKKKHWWSFKRD